MLENPPVTVLTAWKEKKKKGGEGERNFILYKVHQIMLHDPRTIFNLAFGFSTDIHTSYNF